MGEGAAGPGPGLPRIRIFVASPSDVAEEREVAVSVIRTIARAHQGRAVITPVVWEREPLLASASFQEEIRRRASPADVDVAVFVFWSRLGHPLGPEFTLPDGRRPMGTEWEFEEAQRAHRERGSPKILVYRRTEVPRVPVDASDHDDRRDQWRAVEAFFARRFRRADDGTFVGSYHGYESVAQFGVRLEEHLRKLLAECTPAGTPRSTWEGSPYRGLKPFEAEHAAVFFGRTRAIHEVRDALARQVRAGRAFVLVTGRSGCGKSSLVRAGVLPFLLEATDRAPTDPGRRALVVLPGRNSDPIVPLAEALRSTGLFGEGESMDALASRLRCARSEVVQMLREALGANAVGSGRPERLVLVVDQLEEIFTRSDTTSEARTAFVRAIDALARSGCVWVLATMRSDLYPALVTHPELVALKEGSGLYDLPPVDAAETAEVIRGPAAVAGLRFGLDPSSGRALDEILLVDATRSPNLLPHLQYALTELEASADGSTLTYVAYERMARLDGAVASRAEAVWRGLDESARTEFPRLVRRLVEVRDDGGAPSPRRATLANVSTTPSARRVVEALVAAHLLVADGDDEQASVAVAHEALLTTWPRMRDQIRSESATLAAHRRLREAATRYQASHRDASLLLPVGRPLEDARSVAAAGFELTTSERGLLDRSERRARAARWRRTAVVLVLALLAVATSLLAAWANRERTEADREREAAEREREVFEALSAVRDVLARWQDLAPADEGRVNDARILLERAAAAAQKLPKYEAELASLEDPSRGGADPADARRRRAARALRRQVIDDTRAVMREPDGPYWILSRRFAGAEIRDDKWSEATAAIAASPRYRGERLPRRWCLEPIGEDKQSGLWEFAHRFSGRIPARTPGGSIRPAADDAIVFVLVPRGRFVQGASRTGDVNVDPDASDPEGPPHEVAVEPFYLAKFECTQAQWMRLTGGTNPSQNQRDVDAARTFAVETVSWSDACGTRGVLSRYGMRLPYEAEWEFACRAPMDAFGVPTPEFFQWGHASSAEEAVGRVFRFEFAPVGDMPANGFGFHDMHAGVSEWCMDWFSRTYYPTLPRSAPDDAKTPRGPSERTDERARSIRGGCWSPDQIPVKGTRSTARHHMAPGSREDFVGVRPALDLADGPAER